VRNAEIGKIPGELRSERGVVIRLDSLNGKGKMLTDLREEVNCGLCVVVVVNSQNTKASGLVNSCELIEGLAGSSRTWNELPIELDRTARNLEGCVRWFGTGRYFFSEIRPI